MRGSRPTTALSYRVVSLVVAMFLISTPLLAVHCTTESCAQSKSDSMAHCEGMEMPPELGPLPTNHGSSCCQVSQVPPRTRQVQENPQTVETYAFSKGPEFVPSVSTEKQVPVLSLITASPPDRQSLLCTLLI